MVLTYGAYFTLISGAPVSTLIMLELFGAVTVFQVIAVVISTAVLAALSSDEARAKPDERDRAVARRGASIAYFVLIVGVIVVGVVMPFRDTGWRLTNAALFAPVLAETVRYLTVVVSYRRGWRG
jgi:cytochrome bd-type quinol oxidase subunit 2